jgi:hypothetical protein
MTLGAQAAGILANVPRTGTVSVLAGIGFGLSGALLNNTPARHSSMDFSARSVGLRRLWPLPSSRDTEPHALIRNVA